jgi:hypothetical protein
MLMEVVTPSHCGLVPAAAAVIALHVGEIGLCTTVEARAGGHRAGCLADRTRILLACSASTLVPVGRHLVTRMVYHRADLFLQICDDLVDLFHEYEWEAIRYVSH